MNNYTFPISKSNKMYIDIYEHIKDDILKGELSKDEKLPSKRVLAKNLNVSLNTIINAYDILLLEGYIYSVEKKGYFVADFLGFDYKDKENKEVVEEIKKDNYLYDFTTSNIDYNLFPKSVFNTITKDIIYNDETFYNRFDYKGSINLRNQIKKLLYEEKNIDVLSNQIIIGENVHSLINDIIRLLNVKRIMIENPGYYKKNSFNIDVIYNHMDKKGFSIKEFIDSNVKVAIVTSFLQFPTGIKMPMDRKMEISNYIESNDKYIIEDSFDSSFRNNGYQTIPLFNLSSNVIFLGSFSRTMFPGLCISYMVLPKQLIKKYEEIFSVSPKSIPSLDQIILTKFIESGKYSNHVNRLRTSFLNKKKLILNKLNDTNLNIVSTNNYSSVLVELNESIDIDKLKKEFINKKIKISFINDFMEDKVKKEILIIGFSSIDISLIDKGIDLIIDSINSCLKIGN